jgi:hypothetical protein
MEKKRKENLLGKWIFFALKMIFFIILGFLPSFLFVALFVQYGSAFSNYVTFLSNLSASWMAWLSAAIIILLLFSIGRAIKSPKEIKKTVHNKSKFIIVIFSLLIVVGLILGQLYLYINFVLGNDILVKVSADKDNFFFANSSQEEVNFRISVTMNPFCVAQCDYEFLDLSSGKKIESGVFNINSILSKTKTYSLNKTDVPTGSQNLNSFEITCKSKKTILCFTSEEENKRTVLITLNNQISEEEQTLLNGYKEKFISLKQIYYLSERSFEESIINLNNIAESFSTANYPRQNLSTMLSELNDSFYYVENLWMEQELNSFEIQLPFLENDTFDLYNETFDLESKILSDISIYNNLTNKITYSKEVLNNVKNGNLSEQLCLDLNNTITNFNDAILDFESETRLSVKEIIINNIYSQIVSLYDVASMSSENFVCITDAITSESFNKIIYTQLNQSIQTITLEEPAYSCCYLGKCGKCCDNSCSDKNYPVIFLHGHSMNKALPADYSFDTFMEIKGKLSDDGYIDAGAFIISDTEESGLWGRVNEPIAVTASYFFDTYKTSTGESTTVASKTDGIDTYAIRLRNIVNTIKERTNKDKVIIVAHSMGGVVTRRYLQIFGGDNVDKIILITVPNHGITDKIKDYCAVFGSETACNDMKSDSILINQVNNDETNLVSDYNIIGSGCNMGDETGDGIVKNSSQFLDYATNYYVNGTCNELNFDYFHESILSPKLYPEVYEILKKILL